MAPSEFRMPSILLQGTGCQANLGKAVGKLGVKNALIVTGKIVERSGYVEKTRRMLEEAGVDSFVFSEVLTEPTDKIVEEGLKAYRENSCDFLVGLGGGSPMDTVKAIGLLATNGGRISDYIGIDKVPLPTPPLAAIATTAGTGSEVTRFSIISDTEKGVKMLIGSPFLIPSIAVADPLLTLSAPPGVTVATGLDAFCHAIESFVSKKSQPLTDILALDAIKLIGKHLRKAWCSGDNLESRENMMLAATQAGMAINNASVTLIHGMSRPIGALFHVPHGISNAVLLPVWAEFTYLSKPEKFALVAEAMGENIQGLSILEAAARGVESIARLCRDLEVPRIRELIPDKEAFEKALEKMANDALASGSPSNNPRSVNAGQIIELYKKAY